MNLEKLKKKRSVFRSSATKLVTQSQTLLESEDFELEKVEDLIFQLEDIDFKLKSLNTEIEGLIDLDAFETEVENCEEYEEKISKGIRKLKRKLESKGLAKYGRAVSSETDQSNSQGLKTKVNVKLPKLTIEKFSGDPRNWTEFWNSFSSTIHQNNSLSKVEKFAYLKTYLCGKAQNIVSGFELSDENYDSCINALEDRYGRRDLIINSFMNKILNLEAVKSSSNVRALRQLYDELEISIRNLDAMNVVSTSYGYLLIPILLKLLPNDLVLEFNRQKTNKRGDVEVTELLKFIKSEIECRETSHLTMYERNVEYLRNNKVQYENNSFRARKPSPLMSALVANTKMFCCFCKNDSHESGKCDSFSNEEKRMKLRNEGRCYRCFRKNHLSSQCKSKVPPCDTCRKYSHNKLFCKLLNEAKVKPEEQVSIATTSVGSENINNVLLQTCAVRVINNKNSGITRVMFDSGSERTFIKSELAKRLKLTPIRREILFVYSFGIKTPREKCYDVVQVKIQNLKCRENSAIIEALVTDIITENCVKSANEKIRKTIKMKGIEIADLRNVNEVGILIGGEYFWMFQSNRLEKISKDLFLTETLFGWTVQGQAFADLSKESLAVMRIGLEQANEVDVNKVLKSFWELESLGIHDSDVNKRDDKVILEEFESGLEYINGRYCTSLLWKPECKENLNNNFAVAQKRLESLIPKLKRDKWVLLNYNLVIGEQLDLGIIEECELGDLDQNSYYMPHKPVVKRDSETTKLRIVYDASSKEGNFYSLNDCLMAGPNLNPNILDLIIGFREHKVAFSADIEKAYLQIGIKDIDRNFLRFLYFDNEKNNELKCYRMARVPFGVACSSFLLAATIKCHIKKYKEGKPEVFYMLNNCVYVDDLFFGADSVEKAYHLSTDAIDIFRDAGMNLRKFQSNSVNLKEMWLKNNAISCFDDHDRKILGLVWDMENDTLKLEINSLLKALPALKNTKRHVLKTAGKIFDPAGFISPFVIRIKILLQELWQLGLDFDDDIPSNVSQIWHVWCSEIESLKMIEVSRSFSSNLGDYLPDDLQLHIFSDASPKAYGAVAYLRNKINGKTVFLIAKSRVAPLKKLTLPRLELMGAVVAARLAQYLIKIIRVTEANISCWADSEIALYWIRGSAGKWKQFVGNRVQEIQNLTDPNSWKFCRGYDNPADLLTRGCSAQKLVEDGKWWFGPPWLREPLDLWPCNRVPDVNDESVEQERKNTTVLELTVEKREDFFGDIVFKFSSWTKVLRVTAWCIRFMFNVKNPHLKRVGYLQTCEIQEAHLSIIRNMQREEFSEEIKLLKSKKAIKTHSKLVSLDPFLDDEEMLRVGGRLKHASIPKDAKHPIILPKSHVITELIVQDYHLRYLHGGVQLLNGVLREKYWIVSSRTVIKKIIKKCVICCRQRSNVSQQIMSDLPASRVSPGRVFSRVGLDYAGPFQVRPRKGRGVRSVKAYVCVFVCFIVKAVHLELVSNLTTESFIAALKRFIARRGRPEEIYSDCGKNFVGAFKELRVMVSKEGVSTYLSSENIRWKFNPPSAPHFGGLWEAAVKSMKYHLKRVVGLQVLTIEEFLTYLAQVEACLNSRPLVPVSSEPEDLEVITPGHFLIGSSLSAMPEPDSGNIKISLTDRWKLVQQMYLAFWHRWSKEYLSNLQERNKWRRPTPNISVNDFVLIKEDNVPPLKWRMGRVLQVYPGPDSKVRVVKLKTQSGELKRAVHKLCLLPVNS